MPSTINYTQLSTVLPPQRLQMYQKVFETQNDIELHGAYIWSLKVAASIQPLLSILEVALRNAIHYHATNAIGPNWYDTLHTKTRKGWQKAPRDKSNIHWHKAEVERIKKKLKSKTKVGFVVIANILLCILFGCSKGIAAVKITLTGKPSDFVLLVACSATALASPASLGLPPR